MTCFKLLHKQNGITYKTHVELEPILVSYTTNFMSVRTSKQQLSPQLINIDPRTDVKAK